MNFHFGYPPPKNTTTTTMGNTQQTTKNTQRTARSWLAWFLGPRAPILSLYPQAHGRTAPRGESPDDVYHELLDDEQEKLWKAKQLAANEEYLEMIEVLREAGFY